MLCLDVPMRGVFSLISSDHCLQVCVQKDGDANFLGATNTACSMDTNGGGEICLVFNRS